jgi:hypothetical protein
VNDVRRTGENEPPGCLVIPALIVVVPIRLLWELLGLIKAAVVGYVLRPLGWLVYQGLVRPVAWVSRLLWGLLGLVGRAVVGYVLRPVGWLVYQGLVRPVAWFFRVPLVGLLRWVGEAILAPLGRILYHYLLRPLGRGLAWCVSTLFLFLAYAAEGIVRGLAVLWRVGWPLSAALGRGIAYAWRLAGIVLFHFLVRPVRWVWRTLVRPVLRGLSRAWHVTVLTPARWARVNVLKPSGAAVRSVFRALGLDTRRL